MTDLDARAFTEAYGAVANEAQAAMDRLTYAAGYVAGLAERGDRPDALEEARASATEQLRLLRLAVDDVDAVIGNHLHGGHLMGGRCSISEVRPTGLAQCTRESGHGGDHNFPR